ncbi:CocE/NonD family hydrolase [Solicola gregarius]|uniref:CocE/NonD family hydrolase n=1 Tax=Solicola gregarius TaxID=2908642 RepID=A0AA46TLC5_9ACTN|nr:CocE/NonD family hydrolase [Solicola gregarius]UYM07401.1 CocE/NonD family hydrolase [Solicola gregarius]
MLRRVLTVIAAVPLAIGLLGAPVDASTPPSASTKSHAVRTAPAPAPTEPQYDYADAIRETVWVEAPDLDGNGEPDRVAADIIRPRELNGEAQIPVVMDASPYYSCCGRGNESELKLYNARGGPEKFPLYYDNYFVPRGYGYVAVDMAGTSRSTGCTDEGADSDILSVKAVIDWLNGRGRAVDRDGNEVSAGWSDGKVGMIGKSYDGTLANGVAATGVEGLETIVPIAAISSWYDYTRYQGLPFSYDYPTYLSSYVEGDRSEDIDCSPRLDEMAANDGDETGDYTDFWADRDYREGADRNAANVTASVFIAHGLQDFNVKTPNFSRWWDDLGENGVERKMWLTRVGHTDPFDSARKQWVDTLHRWFDHELMGVDNGIDREPAVRAEVAPDKWVSSPDWPVSKRTVKLRPQRNGSLVKGRHSDATAEFVNDPQQDESDAITAGNNPHRLLFTTGRLGRAVRLSGSAEVRLDIAHAAETGQVGVALVDYGPSRRVVDANGGVHNLDTESCWGAATPADDACYTDVAKTVGRTPLQVLSRGWARLNEGDQQRVTVTLTANDVRVPKGHRIGLAVVGASHDWVVTVDDAATEYAVSLRDSVLRLPIDGKLPKLRPGKSLVPKVVPQRVLAEQEDVIIPR